MIDVSDVCVELGGDRILDGITFSVNEGEVVGLIGPNGAGKTTLIRAIDGLIAPTAGDIRVAGDPVMSLGSRELARRIAVLSQSTAVQFGFSVRDIVAMGRTPYATRLGRDDDRGASRIVEEALTRSAIAHLADRPITEVSGGERQRVLIARAIAQETPVLLLDEPTASLDINHQVATLEFVRSLAREGKSVLAAIHDLDLAARYCDRLLLLASGEQRAIGTPASVLRKEHIEPAFNTEVSISIDPITRAPKVTPIPSTPDTPGVHIHVIGYGGSAGSVCRQLSDAGYTCTVGIVRDSGPDHQLAQGMGIQALAVPPGAPLEQEVIAKQHAMVKNAAVTVLSPLNIGDREIPLLESALESEQGVILVDRPFSDRNYAGTKGDALWQELTRRYATTTSEALLDTLAAVLTDPSGHDAEQPNSPGPES